MDQSWARLQDGEPAAKADDGEPGKHSAEALEWDIRADISQAVPALPGNLEMRPRKPGEEPPQLVDPGQVFGSEAERGKAWEACLALTGPDVAAELLEIVYRCVAFTL